MSDLISRSALEQSFDEGCVGECGCCEHHHERHVAFGKWEEWCDLIKNAPTIDAVEVVRCRECVFRHCADLCPMCWRVSAMDEMRVIDITEDDGFCHKGAKMDGGAT